MSIPLQKSSTSRKSSIPIFSASGFHNGVMSSIYKMGYEVISMILDSELSSSQIQTVLSTITKPMTFSNCLTGNIFVSKYKDKKFYLNKTPKYGTSRSQKPFIGIITDKENGSTITGRFAITKTTRIMITLPFAVFWIFFLSIAINFDFFEIVVYTLLLIVWSAFLILFFTILPNIFFKKRQKEVIDFIIEHLTKA